MVTFVGMQSGFNNSMKDLVELEFDAVEAYEVAADRIINKIYKNKILEFLEDHRRHIRVLSENLNHHGEEAPNSPSIGKQWVTKGKVFLGSLVGDKSILAAIRSNEIDTYTAFERMLNLEDMWEDSIEELEKALQDEKRHKAWLDTILS